MAAPDSHRPERSEPAGGPTSAGDGRTDALRVAHYVRRWLPQTQTWLYNQVRYLPGDVEPHVICERTEHLDQFDVPDLHALRADHPIRQYWEVAARMLGLRRYYPYTRETAAEVDAEILHSHFGQSGWQNVPVARALEVPHVVTVYGNDVSGYPRKDERWIDRYEELFATVDGVLCEGPHMAESVADLGCAEEKVFVHHLGVAIDEIEYRPRRYERGEPLRVLIAASFREKKGIPYALEAIGRLRRSVAVEVTVVGGVATIPILGPITKTASGSAAERDRIEATIREWNLEDCVRLLGYQPHETLLREAYEHHLFLSPSVTAGDGETEGGAPVTLIEMSATGMPIVSTTHCDIPSVVPHGESGLLAPERDVAALVDHMRHLVEHPDLWPKMAEAGRTHVEAEYNAPVQGERLAEIYRRIAR